MNYVAIKHKYQCNQPSDCNEHLPKLFELTKECESVLALCGCGFKPYWTFTHGLLNNQSQNKTLYYNNEHHVDLDEYNNVTKHLKLTKQFTNLFSLDVEVESVDLLFIDSWHVYGCVKRELEKFAPKTNKYIVLHDTTVDEWDGETVRCNMDAIQQSQQTGIPVYEIKKGVWPAVQEFLNENSNWVLKERFENNNGLTILEKIA